MVCLPKMAPRSDQTCPLLGQAAQTNAVARAGINRDAIARGSPDGRGAGAVVDDALIALAMVTVP